MIVIAVWLVAFLSGLWLGWRRLGPFLAAANAGGAAPACRPASAKVKQ